MHTEKKACCVCFEDERRGKGRASIHASAHAAKVCDQGGISTVTPQSTFLDKSRFPIEMKAKRHLRQCMETERRSCFTCD